RNEEHDKVKHSRVNYGRLRYSRVKLGRTEDGRTEDGRAEDGWAQDARAKHGRAKHVQPSRRGQRAHSATGPIQRRPGPDSGPGPLVHAEWHRPGRWRLERHLERCRQLRLELRPELRLELRLEARPPATAGPSSRSRGAIARPACGPATVRAGSSASHLAGGTIFSGS